jgi:hypothetical protein
MDDRLREFSEAGNRQIVATACARAADLVVPEYRNGKQIYSCSGMVAKKWQTAWDGACWALGHNPKDWRKRPADRENDREDARETATLHQQEKSQ